MSHQLDGVSNRKNTTVFWVWWYKTDVNAWWNKKYHPWSDKCENMNRQSVGEIEVFPIFYVWLRVGTYIGSTHVVRFPSPKTYFFPLGHCHHHPVHFLKSMETFFLSLPISPYVLCTAWQVPLWFQRMTHMDSEVVIVAYLGGYVLVDNGYHPWPVTVPLFPRTNVIWEIWWLKWVESMRKDVEYGIESDWLGELGWHNFNCLE